MNDAFSDADKIIKLLEIPTGDRRPLKRRLIREAPLKALIEALGASKLVRTRRILCDILGARRAKSAIQALVDCLDDPDWEVRNDAAEALANIGDSKAGEALLRHLIDEPLPAYAIALGSVRYRPAIPFLVEALASDSPNLRGGAAWSLGEFRVTEAVSSLENALSKEDDEYASRRIRAALEQLKGGV